MGSPGAEGFRIPIRSAVFNFPQRGLCPAMLPLKPAASIKFSVVCNRLEERYLKYCLNVLVLNKIFLFIMFYSFFLEVLHFSYRLFISSVQPSIIYFVLFLCRKAHPDKVSDAKQYRTTPDWSDDAVNGDHLWTPAQMSGDLCYAGDMLECTVSGKYFSASIRRKPAIRFGLISEISRGLYIFFCFIIS